MLCETLSKKHVGGGEGEKPVEFERQDTRKNFALFQRGPQQFREFQAEGGLFIPGNGDWPFRLLCWKAPSVMLTQHMSYAWH